jgi:hypothetical protein
VKEFRVGNPTGILHYLITKGKSIVNYSRSSCDPFHLTTGKPADTFATADASPANWIEFQFCEECEVSEIRLWSTTSHHLKSWALMVHRPDGKDRPVYEFDEETALQRRAEFRTSFDPVKARQFRIVQTGPAWDGGNSFALANVDFGGPQMSNGKSLFRSTEDLRKFVRVISNESSELHNQDNLLLFKTYVGTAPWMQIDVGAGTVKLTGYRVRSKVTEHRYAVQGSNNADAKFPEWQDIETTEEVVEGPFLKVACPSQEGFRFLKFVLKSESEAGLAISHCDLFGTWIHD